MVARRRESSVATVVRIVLGAAGCFLIAGLLVQMVVYGLRFFSLLAPRPGRPGAKPSRDGICDRPFAFIGFFPVPMCTLRLGFASC